MSDAASITQIIDYLKTNFIHTDNVEVDYSVSKQIVMEATASLAIEAHSGKQNFSVWLKDKKPLAVEDKKQIFSLSPEMTYYYRVLRNYTDNYGEYKQAEETRAFTFLNFVVDMSTLPYTWRPYFPKTARGIPFPWNSNDDINKRIQVTSCDINGTLTSNTRDYCLHDSIDMSENYDNIIAQFETEYGSKYQLYKSISTIKSPDEALVRFLGQKDAFWGMQEKVGSYENHPFDFSEDEDEDNYFHHLYRNSPEKPYEILLNSYLCDFCLRSMTHHNVGFCVDKVYRTDKYQAVFPFRDSYNATFMVVVKCYDPDIPRKFYVPVTTWYVYDRQTGASGLAATTCVPYPGKQPLFNLDLIATQEAKTVIITDSLDIASLNEKNSELPGLVFTSFLCHEDNYDQVDWSPLSDEDNKVERLLLLVTNHSGYSLEEAYDKAKQLADYLDTNVLSKREGIEIEFIQLEVRYDKAKYSQHFAGWVTQLEDTYTNDSMKSHLVDEESVMHLTSAEFGEMYTRSQTPPKRFWEEDDTEDDSSPSSEDQKVKEKKYPIPYLMRPLICRGKTTMIYGPKASGKSLLSQSIAMAVVNANAQRPTRIFPEQLWRVNKPTQSDLDKGYECRKVLYLNFELAEEMASRQKDFEHSLWGDKENICKPNMIIEDMRNPEYNNVNFSLPENHEKIYKLLDKAQSKGIKDQPVDLLVIDTYTGFVKMEKDDTSKCFTQFCNDLYARNKNISILVVHHANKSNAPRGSQIKLDAMYMALSIDLIDSAKGAFSSCSYKYPNRNNPDKVINFTGRLNEKHLWVVDSIEGYAKPDEKRMTKDVCKQYNFLHHSKSNQAIMLGVSENTLRNQLKSK